MTTTMSLCRIASIASRVAGRNTNRGFSALVSAADEFPGIPATSPEPSKASKASVTTLSNGLTVVSEDAASTTTVSLTYPKAGSSNESVSEAGAALANKCLAFKSASGLSSALLLRNLEDDGAFSFASADRTSALVGFTAAPEKAMRLVPLLATTCDYAKWDVRDALAAANVEAEEAASNAQVVLTEQLFGAAYGAQSSMGRPFYTPGASLSSLQSFRSKAYGINGAVLAATGISDHAAFCTALEERLSEAPISASVDAAAPSAYLGGEARIHVASIASPQVALAFCGPTSSVMGAILKECLAIQGAASFCGDGLVGVYGSDVDSMSTMLTTKPTADVIKRATHLAKSKAMFGLEASGSASLASAMTAQVLETGSFDASGKAFDATTSKAVSAAYDAMLASGVTMASVGDLSSVPYHGTVATRFS
eukprot:CAMPEP_0119015912 /NCGR_PEP_ID=MMETSP1176-20130426/11718_1 /TAXON_ID=265551 /ORGANISM="Synedropsis recta cf, Strain CCMP1620" /LENGTH=424 /DNA_ID=CAMNT_0006969237 /DNA_START=39 /DNA_END=1313 /DNA_ORIENTATION=+